MLPIMKASLEYHALITFAEWYGNCVRGHALNSLSHRRYMLLASPWIEVNSIYFVFWRTKPWEMGNFLHQIDRICNEILARNDIFNPLILVMVLDFTATPILIYGRVKLHQERQIGCRCFTPQLFSIVAVVCDVS